MRQIRFGFCFVVACATSAAPSAWAAPVVETSFRNNTTTSFPTPYEVSATDLINGLTPTAQAGNFTQEGTGGTGKLTDGAYPAVNRPLNFPDFATGGNAGGTSVTYTLATPSNINAINTYGGWQDGGRDQQSYTVSYATAANPGTFLPIATVNFNPPDPGSLPQATRVKIYDDALEVAGTPLALNAAAIRFDFNATENGYAGYAEFDVLGAPVPEPTTLGLLALASVGLLARRRRA